MKKRNTMLATAALMAITTPAVVADSPVDFLEIFKKIGITAYLTTTNPFDNTHCKAVFLFWNRSNYRINFVGGRMAYKYIMGGASNKADLNKPHGENDTKEKLTRFNFELVDPGKDREDTSTLDAYCNNILSMEVASVDSCRIGGRPFDAGYCADSLVGLFIRKDDKQIPMIIHRD